MNKTIEEAAKEAITDNNFFMADPNNPSFVDRGLEQMRACKWVINHIFSLPLAQRLTADEKERVRTYHKLARDGYRECNCADKAVAKVLESIFGAEFFKEEE